MDKSKNLYIKLQFGHLRNRFDFCATNCGNYAKSLGNRRSH